MKKKIAIISILLSAALGCTSQVGHQDVGQRQQAGECDPPPCSGGDGGSRSDGGTDAGTDGGLDGGMDGGADGGADGGFDAGTDGGIDGGSDAGMDGGTDAGVDGGTDAGTDGGLDGGMDGGADGGADGGSDAGTDGGVDGGTDGGEPWIMLGDRDGCKLPKNGGIPGATYYGFEAPPDSDPDPIDGPGGSEALPDYPLNGFGDEASTPYSAPERAVSLGDENSFWHEFVDGATDDDLKQKVYFTLDKNQRINCMFILVNECDPTHGSAREFYEMNSDDDAPKCRRDGSQDGGQH